MEIRRMLASTLALLLHACVHGASPVLDGADEGLRFGGQVSSAAARLHLLLAEGRYAEAEELLAIALDTGLLTMDGAVRMQERLDQVKARQREAEEASRGPPTCGSEHPMHPVCQELPGEYSFHSARQALEVMSSRLGEKSLTLHHPESAQRGPCPRLGLHYNVRLGGQRMGSIA